MTAQNSYKNDRKIYSIMHSDTKEQLESKLQAANSFKAKVGYSWGWVIFWTVLFVFVGLLISLIIMFVNHNKRQEYWESEIINIQNILNKKRPATT